MLVHIDSAQRNSGTKDRFQINFGQVYDLPDKVKVSLVNLILPQTWGNVRQDEVFHYNDGVDKTITIPAGDYTSNEFKAIFESVLVGYTITFSSTTGKVTINSSSAFVIQWSKHEYLAKLLGFEPIDTASAISHTSQNQYNMSPDRYVFLDIGSANCLNAKHIHASFPIPVFGNGGSFSSGENVGWIRVQSVLFRNPLNVRLIDQDGNQLVLQHDWSFTLQLDY